ncbi:MAG: hypothetical protein GC151_03085 [Betaproteobacteria bacterium]|nr:hypothetical protein [Betaproteobacteria bacterium]
MRNPVHATRAALFVLTALSGAVLLAACTTTSGTAATSSDRPGSAGGGSASQSSTNYQPVTDIPIPPGTKINTERSVILGGPDKWFGRMLLVLDRSSTMAYSYYVEQMPAFGWELVTAVQGKVATLTYIQGQRAATVEIAPATLRGSEVTVTMSPRPTAGTRGTMPPTTK